MSAIRIPYEDHGEQVPRWYDGKAVYLLVILIALLLVLAI
jgi:hypothetical protein